jgi:hypothetical protein
MTNEVAATARKAISDLLSKVPPGYPVWSWDRAHEFAKAAESAQKVMRGARATPQALELALRVLKRYYEAEK